MSFVADLLFRNSGIPRKSSIFNKFCKVLLVACSVPVDEIVSQKWQTKTGLYYSSNRN